MCIRDSLNDDARIGFPAHRLALGAAEHPHQRRNGSVLDAVEEKNDAGQP